MQYALQGEFSRQQLTYLENIPFLSKMYTYIENDYETCILFILNLKLYSIWNP